MIAREEKNVLGGLGVDEFLERHWQKRPLLVRQAIPAFGGFVDDDDLFRLAEREGVNARVVVTEHGLRGRRAYRAIDVGGAVVDRSRMPRDWWTLLVQGVESLHPSAWDLLRAFSFLPRARIDDLMISYAVAGGSVGPHVDRYDVFLLQGAGRRRWRFDSKPRVFVDSDFDPRQHMRVLADRAWDRDEILEPGDMLYLPPNVAHWGEAVDDCFTYSIGFLAPSHDAIVQNFMAYFAQVLEQRVDAHALYDDPDLMRTRDPIAVDDAMIGRFARILEQARFNDEDVADFVGRYLTGPKPSARFVPKATSRASFANALSRTGTLRLALASRGLVRGRRVFLNGDAIDVDAKSLRTLRALIDERAIELPIALPASIMDALHAWTRAGFLVVDARSKRRSSR